MSQVRGTCIGIVVFSLLFSMANLAQPVVSSNPTTIARDYTGTVQLDVSNVMSGAVMVLLYQDVDGDGIQDIEDNAIWLEVIEDNAAEWSPNQFSDTNATPGVVSADLRLFTLTNFPYAAGSYFWQAIDPGFGTSAVVPFTVTQPALSQSVSGTVLDDDTSNPVPGTLVWLDPFCDEGDSAYELFAAWTDMSGNYTIQVPASLTCDRFAVVALAPQYITWQLDLPMVNFTGADNFSAVDFRLEKGDHAVTGTIQYQNGPRAGQGIPGARLFVSSDGLPAAAITLSDNNGNFTVFLDDGDWVIEAPEAETAFMHGLAPTDGISLQVTVSGSGVSAGTMQVPAANAYFTGTLTDETGTPLAGRWVSANRDGVCSPNCYAGADMTDPNGDFVIGVLAPNGPAVFTYRLQAVDPLSGLIAQNRGCETISAGQTLGSKDLTHVNPTDTLSGSVVDKDGNALDNYCLRASASPGCTWYASNGRSDCSGDYQIPVIDGSWNVSSGGSELDVIFRNLDETEIWRNINVSGASQSGLDYVIGGWPQYPRVEILQNTVDQENGQVRLIGRGFDTFGTTPEVWINGTAQATVLAYRPTQGYILAQLPGGLTTGTHSLAVTNVDLGWVSNDLCIDITAGTYTPACSISGFTEDPGTNPLADAMVLAFDGNGDFVAGDVSDGAGAFSIDLPAAGNYDLWFLPPEGSAYINEWVTAVPCGGGGTHTFSTGSQVTGYVADATGNDISNARIIAREIGGSGHIAFILTDNGGNFTHVVPNGTYFFVVRPPAESRWVPPNPTPTAIAGNTNLGTLQVEAGVMFCGRLQDAAGQGLSGRVNAYRRSDSLWRGRVDPLICDGQFDIPLIPGEEVRLDLITDEFPMTDATQVKWITPSYDTVAPHPFTLFSDDSLQHSGSEPRILRVGDFSQGQEGQPLDVKGENFAGTTLDVLFSDGSGGFVAGTGTWWDAERGIALTRIPAGAASGSLKVRVDGVDSLEHPFKLLPGVFNPGTSTVSGNVQDQNPNPVQDVMVLLLHRATGTCGEDDFSLLDYGLTNASGDYSGLNHSGGDLLLSFWPPRATMLASHMDQQSAVSGNIVVNASLQIGNAVSLRVVDDNTVPAPVPGAMVDSQDDNTFAFDQVITDSNGDATLYLLNGDYEFTIQTPVDSRLNEAEWFDTISGATNYGDTTVNRGVMISTQASSGVDGSVLPISQGESFAGGMSWTFFREDNADLNGVVHMSGLANSTVSMRLDTADDALVGQEFSADVTDADCILYPPFAFDAAGFLSGTVVEDGTLTPLADIELSVIPESGGMPAWGNSYYGRTCTDGTYQIKVPAGTYYLTVNVSQDPPWVSEWYQDAFCDPDATTVQVLAGQTTIADVELDKGGTISGTATLNGNPLENYNVCATGGALGSCWACSYTDVNGNYTLGVPPGTGYRVEIYTTFNTSCYDGFNGCQGYTPVEVVEETDTPNIDFIMGCSTPAVVFSDDMESGTGSWTTSGLWHQVSDPTCSPASNSSSTSWYYGQDGSCNVETGGTHSGSLTSATFAAVAEGAQLLFTYRLEQDGNCGATDEARVELSVDAGPFSSITTLCDTEGTWKQFWMDLTPYYDAGSDLQIRFVFDTVDDQNNTVLGWMIDDVELSTCLLSAPGEPSASGSGVPLQITDVGSDEITVQAAAGATAYNVYVDLLGDFYTPTSGEGSVCTVTNWSVNLDGTITLPVVIPDNRWVVVSASNGAGESSAGQDSSGGERTSAGSWVSCTLGP